MTQQVVVVIGVIGSLIGIAGLAGALYAGFKGSANEATIARLRAENVDYLGRLNYIEPRMATAEKQNEVLISLTDPTAALKEILELLKSQHQTLIDIRRALQRGRTPDGK